MIFTNSIETRLNEIKASRKSRSKNFQKFVFFPTHGRRKKFYLRGGVLKPLKKWLLSMIRMETDTTPHPIRVPRHTNVNHAANIRMARSGVLNGDKHTVKTENAKVFSSEAFDCNGVGRVGWRAGRGAVPLPQGFKASWL